MRLLTVRQPWASAIARGAKLVENRAHGFPSSYRGIVGIHAGIGWSKRGASDPRILELFPDAPREHDGLLAPPERVAGYAVHPYFPLGEVLAFAELVDVHPDAQCCRPWGESTYVEAGGRTRTDVAHLVLENVREVAWFVRARGKLGLWRPDPALALELDELLEDAA